MPENDDVVAFQLWDANGKQVVSTGEFQRLPLSFQQRPTENFHESKLRNIYRKKDIGAVRIVTHENDPLFQGTKGVARACAVYLSLIPRFRQIEINQRQHFDSIIKRFTHNLIKFQTRFKGNFNRLISDNARSRPFNELQKEVKARIEGNTSIAAQDVCQMSHRAVDLDAQIDTLRVISGFADSARAESPIRVKLQQTIFRLSNPFIDELNRKSISLIVNIPSATSGEEKVLVAPGLFNAAIWQLLDNASKYALDGTQINITAELRSRPQKLVIAMTSVCVDEDEKEKIFLEGYRGRNAGNKAENGIGLFIVRKALGLMGARVHFENEGFVEEKNGFKYCKNKFTIEFAV